MSESPAAESESGGVQHADSQEIEASPTVHLALQGLESVDVPLRLTIAPRQFESRLHRGQIRLQSLSKCPQVAWAVGCQSSGQPSVEFVGLPVSHHIHKSCSKIASDSIFRAEHLKVFNKSSFFS